MIHPDAQDDRPGGDLENAPAGRPGEDVDPEADPQVDDDDSKLDAAVCFEDPALEAPQDEVPPERPKSMLGKGFSVMGLSTIARRFDRRGVGHLDPAEQRARDLADSQGHVMPDQAIAAMELGMSNEKKLNRTVRHFRLSMVLSFLLFVGLFVAVFYASDKAVNEGNIEVKEKIDESIQTDIAVDSLGAPHLTDKASGKDITVKADGVVAGTTPRVLNGRKLTCISMVDVAKAVNGLATASTSVNLVFHDEDGIETEITPLTNFKDKKSHLAFDGGRIQVRLDSDDCDAAAALDEEETEGGVRHLGRATPFTSFISPKSGSIQAKLRQAYVSARFAVREGRRLTHNVEAEVTWNFGGFIENKAELKGAVDAYIKQNCATNTDCAIGQTYGYPIGTWDVSRVTDLSSLFQFKTSFNGAIGSWDTSSVTRMDYMFYKASAFNQSLTWDTSSVTTMKFMFYGASKFNKDLSIWDTSSVTTMERMFMASAFNQALWTWDTSSVISMESMFVEATSFNQNLCSWGYHYDPTGVKYLDMFSGTNCVSTGDPDQDTNWCEASCSVSVCPSCNVDPDPTLGGYSCLQTMFFGVRDDSKWNLDLQIEALPDGSSMEAYTTAKDKWQSLIVGNLDEYSSTGMTGNQCAGNPYPAVIDDLHICGRDEVIDGAGNVLGSGGPSYVRPGTGGTAVSGYMEFDIADIARLVNDGSWESLILHEMGHVIGIGTLWESAGVVGPGPQYPYLGTAGIEVWQNDWGCSGAPPVETDGTGGTAGGHFDEVCLTNELMTGYADPLDPLFPYAPCSKLTAATLDDLGYTVDYASPFIDTTYDGTSVASGCGCPGGRRNLRNSQARNLQGQSEGRRPISPAGLAKAQQYGQSVLAKNKLPPGLARETEVGAVYVGDLFVGVLYEEEGEIYGVRVTAD